MAGSLFSASTRASNSASVRWRRIFQHRMQTGVLAGLDLVAHIDLAGRVVAHQHHGQAGVMPGPEGGGGACAGDVRAVVWTGRCRR